MYHAAKIFVFVIIPALVLGEKKLEDETEEKSLLITIKNAGLKFRLNQLTPVVDGMVVGPSEIKTLLTKHSCKLMQSGPEVVETSNGHFDVVMDYMCESDADMILRQKTWNWTSLYIILISIVCAGLIYTGIRARKASTAEGEIRWRLWSVPQLSFLKSNRIKMDSLGDIIAPPSNSTVANTNNEDIPSRLEHSMFYVFPPPPRYSRMPPQYTTHWRHETSM